MVFTIRIQEAAIDKESLYEKLKTGAGNAGAIIEFTGCVRPDLTEEGEITYLQLEHYPGMAEKGLLDIANQAAQKWEASAITIVHRVGTLSVGDEIVYLAVATNHRLACFEAIEFIMDYLKNDVPLWKKAITPDSEVWIEQKKSDIERKKRWD